MTLSDLLGKSLGLIGVLREGETPSAEQGSDGLTVFNSVIASLEEDGISLGIQRLADTTTALQLNPGDELTLMHVMAVQLLPFYPGRQLSPVVASIASDGYTRWLRNAIHRTEKPSSMSHLPGPKCAVWNVQSDSF